MVRPRVASACLSPCARGAAQLGQGVTAQGNAREGVGEAQV